MKNKKVLILSIFLIFLGAIVYNHLARKQSNPQQRQESFEEASAKAPVSQEAIKEKIKPQIKVDATQNNTSGLFTESKKEVAFDRDKKEIVLLQSSCDSVTIKVRQGSRGKASFEITNKGIKDALVNIYKSDSDLSDDKLKAGLREIISYKKNALVAMEAKIDLTKAALFKGAGWLIPFPYYVVLKPAESKSIQLTVDAKDLENREYKVDLFILGSSEEELIIIPVYVDVEKGPKIKISRIEINDGFTSDTTGNSNNIANPGEKIMFTVYFRNDGMGQAKDLTLELKPHDSSLIMSGDSVIQVPFVSAQDEFKVSFQAEVSGNAHQEIPPSVSLMIVDSEGEKITENFYLGDPKKIKYPLGLLRDKKTLQSENTE